MKKQFIIAASLLPVIAYEQVGINTDTLKTTIDIAAKRDASVILPIPTYYHLCSDHN